MSLVVVCVTLSLSIMLVTVRDYRRFRICNRWKVDGLSSWKRVDSFISIVIDWTRLLCSRTILVLRWFGMGVFSLECLGSLKYPTYNRNRNFLSSCFRDFWQSLLEWKEEGCFFWHTSPTTLSTPGENGFWLLYHPVVSYSFSIGPGLVVILVSGQDRCGWLLGVRWCQSPVCGWSQIAFDSRRWWYAIHLESLFLYAAAIRYKSCVNATRVPVLLLFLVRDARPSNVVFWTLWTGRLWKWW